MVEKIIFPQMIGKHMAETINTNVKYQSRDANMKSKFLLRARLHETRSELKPV